MPLPSGTRIGGYEVVALLGAGGMGEVYRARDQRLGRDVAIKVLSPQIGADADAILRFEREARALASLNHPNIAAIYGVEDNGAQPALILELVDGETLADRIAQGPLRIDQAIDYAKQIADALDVAHETGIVHRDLKPGNIKITEDGRIKVLDFGLAKAIAIAAGELPDLDPANSPTITVQGTKHGVILGTAAYMSPEQARGKRIDKRTDIWAFGGVLFEMLTGKRAFTGETTSDVIAAIIERAPDLTLLPRSTPTHLRRVIERCLEKDPKRRARDIADVRSELDATFTPVAAPRRISAAALAGMALVTLIAIGVAGLAWQWRPQSAAPTAPIEFTISAPPRHTLALTPAAPSPDGRSIAFVARDEQQRPSLWIRSLDTGVSRRIDGSDGVSDKPEWSPDGRSLAFFVGGVWKRISPDGGPPVTIVSNVVSNLGASWGPGDVFLLSPANRTSLSRVPATGGSLQEVTTLDVERENSHRWPQLLPDGRHFLFTARSDSAARLGIKLGRVDASEVRPLVNVASPGIFTNPGWLLFVTPDQVLMAQRLDPSTWMLTGVAQPVTGPVRYNGPSFSGQFGASLDGRVLTYGAASPGDSVLVWFDRSGKSLGRVGPERDYRSVRLSPDGKRIAVELADPQLGTRDIWLIDAATQAMTRFTSHTATDWRGVFSPDGLSIALSSDRSGASTIFLASTMSPGSEKVFYRHQTGGAFSFDWSRDGTRLLVTTDDQQGRPREMLLLALANGAPAAIGGSQATGAVGPRLSPDGTRVAYVSDQGGQPEVFVMSIADGQRRQISSGGAGHPRWGRDRELFFGNRLGEIMRVEIDGLNASKPEPLMRPCVSVNRSFSAVPASDGYDVTSDGTRFLVICEPVETALSEMRVIVNWQSKLK